MQPGRTSPRRGSRVAATNRSARALEAGTRVAPAPLQRSHLVLDVLVERADVVVRPHHVRRDARALDGGAVPGSVAARMAGVRVEAVTEVAERVAAVMGEEAVRAVPALPEGRVEGVDVDVPAVAVERVPPAGRAEPVDPHAVVREAAEDVADVAVRPVLVDDELRERAPPMGEMQLPRPSSTAEVGLQALPGLERPVAPVRRLAGLDEPGERRPVVREADAAAALAVAELELDLRHLPVGGTGVDRAPGDQRSPAASQRVADVGLAL